MKDELQKLKGQQADLRKAMRQNRKEARNATKRKNRLVKALRQFLKVKAFSSRRERSFVQTVQRLALYCLIIIGFFVSPLGVCTLMYQVSDLLRSLVV